MNILPFILTLLVLLSLSFSQLFTGVIFTQFNCKCYQKFYQASYKAYAARSREVFDKKYQNKANPKEDTSVQYTIPSSPITKTKRKQRMYPSREEGKLNLLTLFSVKEEEKRILLEKAARYLLQALYAPFLGRQEADKLFQAILEQKESLKSYKSFYSFLEKEGQKNRKILFLINGTATYNIQKDKNQEWNIQGVPAFFDYFSLSKEPMVFSALLEPVLSAFLTEAEFLALQKELKKQPLDQKGLKEWREDIAQKFPEKIIYFRKNALEKQTSFYSEKNHFLLRLKH